jgi:mono/diheme cytochrome c family protein
LIIIAACRTHYDTTKDSYSVTPTDAKLERGKNLVYTICGQCHYNKDAGKFIGMQMHEVPSILGKVYSANLTRSKTHGVTDHYTDAELRYLLKRGIANDGRFLSYMLKPNLADEDIDAIIVFLRSDDPAMAPADTTVGKTHLNFIGKIGTSFLGKPVPYQSDVKRPPENDAVATGRYLVDNIGCYHCHSKSFTSINYLNPEASKGYMEGGMKFKTPTGKLYASNLTPDKQTGIGNYTKEEFRKALKDGQSPKRELRLPMPRFTHMTDEQADAIFAYLHTIQAVEHKVD